MDQNEMLIRYGQIMGRKARGYCYRRECNLRREVAQALAKIHRSRGFTARIRAMRFRGGRDDLGRPFYNVYLDH